MLELMLAGYSRKEAADMMGHGLRSQKRLITEAAAAVGISCTEHIPLIRLCYLMGLERGLTVQMPTTLSKERRRAERGYLYRRGVNYRALLLAVKPPGWRAKQARGETFRQRYERLVPPEQRTV